jgi:ArsR family transcriptional regulator
MGAKSTLKSCGCQQVADVSNAPPVPVRGRGSVSIDEMFRAFSDRTRLRILHLLLRGEICVGDLATVLQMTQPRTSQHLACLRNSGLVVGRKEGLWTHYSLAAPRSPFHQKLLECLQLCFAEVPELQEDDMRADDLDRTGRCCP